MILAIQAGVAALRHPPVADLNGRRTLAALAAVIIAAWLALVVMTSGGMAMVQRNGPAAAQRRVFSSMDVSPEMNGMPTMVGSGIPSAVGMRRSSTVMGADFGSGVMWALMIVAMMLPSALPAIAYTASRSLRWRRDRAMVQFAVGYLLVWSIAGAGILAVSTLIDAGRWGLGAVLCAAAVWQLTPLKRRALRDCHRPTPLPPSGWTAELASTRFGVCNSWACVRSCWVMMLVMAVTSAASFAWMLAIAALTSWEKFSERPQYASRRVTGFLALAAGASFLAAVA